MKFGGEQPISLQIIKVKDIIFIQNKSWYPNGYSAIGEFS